MKNVNFITIRYFGADWNRHFCLQRRSGDFWTGHGWSPILDCAQIFRKHKAAQEACNILQYKQYRGKPTRIFRVEMTVTLVAEDVEAISQEQLEQFIADAMRIDIENAVFGDGPVAGSYVTARVNLTTLEETVSPWKRF